MGQFLWLANFATTVEFYSGVSILVFSLLSGIAAAAFMAGTNQPGCGNITLAWRVLVVVGRVTGAQFW